MAQPNEVYFDVGTDMENAFAGRWIDMFGYKSISFQVEYSVDGTPEGTWTVEGTNNLNLAGQKIVTATLEGNGLLQALNEPAIRFIRLTYTPASGGIGDTVTASNYYRTGRFFNDSP